MKLKKEFVLRRLADCNVVLYIGEGAANLNKMTTLNETGRFLWEQLQTEKNSRAACCCPSRRIRGG